MFTIAGETKQGTEFKNFTQNEDGSFTASYQVQLSVEANTREVMKEISENLATAELTGYKRTGTTYSIGENGSQTEYSNSENLSVTIQNRGTGVVSFVNTYAPDAVDISILKINDDANPEALAGAEFSLEAFNGTDWESAVANISVDDHGKADVKDLQYDQLYRLTEIKAPEGYAILPEAVNFKVTKEATGAGKIVPCDADGNKVQSWQEQIQISADDSLQLEIVNRKNPMLPETGGRGTKGICLLGGIFVLGALLALAIRKRQ